MYSHDLKCPTDITQPREVGVCDRCMCKRYLSDLVWQYDYRGNALANLRIRVCFDTCLDTPQEQLRPVIIGPDPYPVRDPRPIDYAALMGIANQLTSDLGNPLLTDDGAQLIPD